MPISLISGPANSGRAGAIVERFLGSLASGPCLIVPTRDDVERFEDELCEREPVLLGGSVGTFDQLFREAGAAAGAIAPPPLTPIQRLEVCRRAIEAAGLRVLARSAAQPGFVASLEGFASEMQAAGLTPDALSARLARLEGRPFLDELAGLYQAYHDIRDGLGRSDEHGFAAAVLTSLADGTSWWPGRPVLLYGFDDLTGQQLELLTAIGRTAEVTVSLTYEEGRAALAARSRTRDLLLEQGATEAARLSPEPANTPSETLRGLERSFLVDDPRPLEQDGGLVLLESAGERAEAEQIGGEIRELMRRGAAPDDIGVVVRRPDAYASLFDQVFSAYGIPAAIDGRVPFGHTALGRGLLALLRGALTTRTAADVVEFLRLPGLVANKDRIDDLERKVLCNPLRTADEALAAWDSEKGRWEFDAVREAERAGALPRRIAEIARNAFEYPHQRTAPRIDHDERLDLRALEEARSALGDLAELDRRPVPPERLIATLEDLRVRLWRGSPAGRVRVTNPYRARVRRVPHLFVAALQEGEFPYRGRENPFLGNEERDRADLPPRARPEDEERYLFYVCLSRPTRTLYLSFRTADEEGQPATPSFFVEDVKQLLGEPLEPRRRTLSDTVFAIESVPSRVELERALAARGQVDEAELRRLGLSGSEARDLAVRLDDARVRSRYLPGPLRVPEVLAELRATRMFGASTLEDFGVCSYRWFVQHELQPAELRPRSDAASQGSAVHTVLERLYLDPPAGPVPTPDSLERWVARAGELLEEAVAGSPLEPADGQSGATYRAMLANVARFLEYEAQANGDGAAPALVPAELEVKFDEDQAVGPLDLGDFAIHGMIDRIDVAAGDRGLVRDYKYSRDATRRAKLLDEGKLQLPLYALAYERLWGGQAIGAVYHPLRHADGPPKGRGMLRESARELIAPEAFLKGEFVSDQEWDELTAAAVERAEAIVERIRGGDITRDPRDGRCPSWCDFHPICRRERGAKKEEEPGTGNGGGPSQ